MFKFMNQLKKINKMYFLFRKEQVDCLNCFKQSANALYFILCWFILLNKF